MSVIFNLEKGKEINKKKEKIINEILKLKKMYHEYAEELGSNALELPSKLFHSNIGAEIDNTLSAIDDNLVSLEHIQTILEDFMPMEEK